MALVLKDRVKGWTDSYGEDNFVIFATTNGYQSFSVIGNGNQTYYTVFDPTNYDWEVGIGTYTAATTTLSRDTILSSSNNNLIVSFLPGTKELFVGYPAEKAVTLDTPQTLTDKTLVSATVTSGTINNTTIGATTPASGAFTTLVASGASLTSVNAGVALLTSATVTTLNSTGASIASANIGNLQFTAASIASINAGVAVITNLSATSASIASMNAGVALLTTATVTTLNATGASIASANIGNLQFTAASIASINAGVAVITNLTATGASIASANVGTAVITTGTVTNLTSTSASVASINAAVALITTGTVTALTATGASVASANVGTAVVTGLTVTNASIASLNAGTATVTTGNLTFSSTGQRITGDMSNATIANRLAFQSSTTNGNTLIGAIPNGTSVTSGFWAFNNSDLTNAGRFRFSCNSTEAFISSDFNGTGTYLPMTFYTGGSERMRLDTSGNLGLGTASPAAKLDIAASVPEARLSASGGATGQLLADGSSFYVGPTGAHALRLQTNGNTRVLVDSSGNVGIGTGIPGSFNAAGLPLVVGSGVGNQGLTIYSGTAGYGGIHFADGTTSTDSYRGIVYYQHTNDSMQFWTSATERMRVDSSGNVQVGTTTAAAGGLLTLNRAPAAAFGTPMLQVGGASFTAGGYYSIGLGFTDATYTEPPGEIVFITDSSSGGTNGAIAFGTRSVTTNTAVSERMRIDSSGNVGIGGTANAYAKVEALGTYPTSGGYTRVFRASGTIPSGTTAGTFSHNTFQSIVSTQAAAFTCPEVMHFEADNVTLGASSAVTNQYGFRAEALTSATNNYGFYSNIASGTNRWNFYAAGTARNYFAGNTGVGEDASTTFRFLASSNSASLYALGAFSKASSDSSIPAVLISKFANDSTTAQVFVQFAINNNTTGSGQINANGASAAAFGTYSDIRLKENIVDLPSQLENICALRPVEFDYKTGGHQIGFIAQEMEKVYSDVVSSNTDEMLMITGWSKTEARLVKAIQELSAKVAALEAK